MRDGTGSRPLLRVQLRIPNALLLARLANIPKHTAVVAGRIPGQSRQPFCPGFAPYFETRRRSWFSKLAFYGESERWPLSQDCLPLKTIRLSRLACGKLGGILRMARLTIDTEDLLP